MCYDMKEHKGGGFMENVLLVAKYICDLYYANSGEKIDELKLHKLLYFVQRESLASTNKPLFQEAMQGWVHGPVSPEVRKYFYNGEMKMDFPGNLSQDSKILIGGIVEKYGGIASWKLRELSHKEISWQNSRVGLSPREMGQEELKIEDIRKDSEKVRPFDYQWGMYYDEMEDAE